MPVERSAYLGPRLRRLRRDLGLTQPDLAAALEISASYVSLIESNQRPITADLLLRLARTYGIDLADFAGDGGEALSRRLQSALGEPLFADLDLPRLQSADVAANYPGIAEAFLRLHSAYAAEQRVLAETREDPGAESGDDPVSDVRRSIAASRNHFPELEEAAEVLSAAVTEAGGLDCYIEARHRLRVRRLPPAVMGDQLRRHDPHHRAVFLADSLDLVGERAQLAVQLAYLALPRELARAEAAHAPATTNARQLFRRALASYAAGAILMPYADVQRVAEERRYDVEAISRRFGVTWEAAAYRLTSLVRPGQEGVPFTFVRVDRAGNVSKRHDAAGFPLGGGSGGCSLWRIYEASRCPGEVISQWVELPDGKRFLSLAYSAGSGSGGHDLPRSRSAVGLVCASEHAHRVVQGDLPIDPTPIGIACRLCQRDRCGARAYPPLGRRILPDDHHRYRAPLGYADD